MMVLTMMSIREESARTPDIPPVRQVLSSPKYLLHLLWGALLLLRYFSFHSFLNSWLIAMTDSKEEVSYFTELSVYAQLGGIVLCPLSGLIYDWNKKHFADSPTKLRRHLMPAVMPLALTSVLGVILSVLVSLPYSVVLYPSLCIFVIYRAFLTSIAASYITSLFHREHIAVLLGLWLSIGGVFSLLQYALFSWAEVTSFQQPGFLLTALCVLSLCHPLYQWRTCRREATHP